MALRCTQVALTYYTVQMFLIVSLMRDTFCFVFKFKSRINLIFKKYKAKRVGPDFKVVKYEMFVFLEILTHFCLTFYLMQ